MKAWLSLLRREPRTALVFAALVALVLLMPSEPPETENR
jgi:hypothetical protein